MKLELPAHKKQVFDGTLTMRWGDMDAMGHVNNVSYFRYMESTRLDWFQSLGIRPDASETGPIILNAFCNFYRQLVYPGDLRLRIYVSDPARCTFESWTTIERVDQPDEIYAAGGATVVWVDFQREKAIDLPDWMRKIVTP